MCRLFGLYADRPVDLSFSLVDSQAGFRRTARGNADGWGLAWYADGNPQIAKGPLPMDRAPSVPRLAAESHSRLFLAHTRLATDGARAVRNCHPFRIGPSCFAHNGWVEREALLGHLDRGRRAQLEGETDSEALFALLLQRMEPAGGSAKRALIGTLGLLKGTPFTALNFVMSDGRKLWAYRRYSADEDRYSLYFLRRGPETGRGPLAAPSAELATLLTSKSLRGERAVLVCSEPLTGDQEPWEMLPDGAFLEVDEELNCNVAIVR